jgi:glycosyltransferase involved in cell wall biosynthesis
MSSRRSGSTCSRASSSLSDRCCPITLAGVRILQVVTDTDRRGAQVFATDLGAAMTERGHDVRTVALARGRQQPHLELDVLGARRRSPDALWRLRRAMTSVDVTIAHGSATALACAVAGGGRRRFVYRQISDTRFWANSRWRRLRVRRYLERAAAIVALSDGAKQDLVEHLAVLPEHVSVVPNGVPVGDFAPPSTASRVEARRRFGLDADAFVVLYIGALVPEKGADVAVRSVAGASGVELLVVGGGPDRQRVEELARRDCDGRVHLAGVLTDPGPAYAAADVVVLPSLGGDSMPATLIEAGFCGLPVVSTPIGSIPDIVIDGETGFVLPPGDEQALRSALECLRDDHQFRQRLGERARRRCLATFEIGVVADGWLDVLDGVVTPRASDRSSTRSTDGATVADT